MRRSQKKDRRLPGGFASNTEPSPLSLFLLPPCVIPLSPSLWTTLVSPFQIAVVITNGELEAVDRGIEFVIRTDKAVLDAMGEWCVDMHGKVRKFFFWFLESSCLWGRTLNVSSFETEARGVWGGVKGNGGRRGEGTGERRADWTRLDLIPLQHHKGLTLSTYMPFT